MFVARLATLNGAYTPSTDVIQFGTAGDDGANDIVGFNSSFVVAGSTTGAFSGSTNSGGSDAFAAEVLVTTNFLFAGQKVQFGTSGDDAITSAFGGIELTAGGSPFPALFLVGSTYGAFSGFTNQGSRDVFFGRIDSSLSPTFSWFKQSGTAADDGHPVLATGADDVFISAAPFLLKASRVSGNTAWSRPNSAARSAATIDVHRNVYILGTGASGTTGAYEKLRAF